MALPLVKDPPVKRFTALAALAAWLPFSLPADAADVAVSVQISQPGVYGRIDIGDFPQPVLVQRQPMIIFREMYSQPVQPVYLWVPPGHRKDWKEHCGKYRSCGVPFYFVQDGWYREYVHPESKGKGKGKARRVTEMPLSRA